MFDTSLFAPLLLSLTALAAGGAIVILAGRMRAGCDFSSFLTLAAEAFHVTPVPWAGEGAATVTARACVAMSKTKSVPLIFHMTLKAVPGAK